MAYSNINVSPHKPKTMDALTRAQDYDERRTAKERTAETPASWRAAREDLRHAMTSGNYIQWIAPARARQDGDTLTILAASDFSRTWLENKLDRQITAALERTGYGHLDHHYAVVQRSGDAAPHPNAPHILFSRDDWAAYTQQRLDALRITPRQGKQSDRYNSPLANRYTMTASPTFFREHPEQYELWLQVSYAFIRDLHGDEQILGAVVHTDQTTPHLHVTAIPIDERGHLSASSFTRTPEQLAELHTLYNLRLHAAGIHLDRGRNAAQEKDLARASAAVRQRAIEVNDIPLNDVLERLDADREVHDPRRWMMGDRLIQVHDDGHGFTEVGPQGASEGDGALDLVARLRQEGETPAEALHRAADYLAITHPDRVRGGAPPLVPHAPEPPPEPPLERVSIAFGTPTRWEPGQFIVVDTPGEAHHVARAAKGWGRVAVAATPEALPIDELDAAIATGHMVDIASRSDAVWAAVQERYADLTAATGRQIWRRTMPTLPGLGKPRVMEKAPDLEPEHGPLAGPDIMMG